MKTYNNITILKHDAKNRGWSFRMNGVVVIELNTLKVAKRVIDLMLSGSTAFNAEQIAMKEYNQERSEKLRNK